MSHDGLTAAPNAFFGERVTTCHILAWKLVTFNYMGKHQLLDQHLYDPSKSSCYAQCGTNVQKNVFNSSDSVRGLM